MRRRPAGYPGLRRLLTEVLDLELKSIRGYFGPGRTEHLQPMMAAIICVAWPLLLLIHPSGRIVVTEFPLLAALVTGPLGLFAIHKLTLAYEVTDEEFICHRIGFGPRWRQRLGSLRHAERKIGSWHLSTARIAFDDRSHYMVIPKSMRSAIYGPQIAPDA